MKRVISIATASVMAVLLALSISVAAQDFNPQEKSYLTFSTPVELPGMTLPAGTYLFQLADTPSRNVVQVFSEDGKETVGQFSFVQHDRLESSDETVVTFRETTAGATPAIQYWYYPGELAGKEFIYPKDQAMRIAARTGATVLSDDGAVRAEAQVAAAAPAPEPVPEPAPVAAAEPAPVTPAPEPAPVQAQAQADTTIADEPAAVGTAGQADELPRTASPLALSGLLGLLSLAGALGIRAFRQ